MTVSPTESDRQARVAWSHLVEPGCRHTAQWFDAFGPREALDRLRAGELETRGSYSARLAEFDEDRQREVLHRLGVRVLVPGDDQWPAGLVDLEAPPVCLYARGNSIPITTGTAVGIVGSRACTAYGTSVAANLAEGLVQRGMTVVSGAAFGIDAAAHRGALAAGGPTVAVLACGLDRAYPKAHEALLRQIVEQGAVLSEVPPGWAPMRHRFISRNRLIAALTSGTVVVEAGLRSGSLNTARHARDLMRHVAAVPGPVTSAQSAGCHALIRNFGASLVTDAAEVLDLVGQFGVDSVDLPRADPTPDGELDAVAHAVWSALPVRGGVDLADLERLTTLDAADLLAALGQLNALGLVERQDQQWRKAARTSTTSN